MPQQTTSVHHPLFARVYARIGSKAEDRGQAEHRRELLAGLSGRVVEVGAGNGLNFPHYPDTVSEVVAVEPEGYLREHAVEAAAGAAVSVRVVDGVAERLPLDDSSVDAGVASLVLCSVPDQDVALRELLRVIRPGGELRFYEHVVSEKRRAARVQGAADATFWPTIGGGCHMARDTGTAIARAGFIVEHCERFSFAPAPLLSLPHIRGLAWRP
ncbi:MAG: class I SAM-dependent methyltransferase [Thermoleophilaceae bacterium]